VDYDVILQTAISIAHKAGSIVRDSFPRTALAHVEFKGAVNPVTETDIAAEQLIVAHLRTAFPDHRILAEEGGGDEWLLDALQATGGVPEDRDASEQDGDASEQGGDTSEQGKDASEQDGNTSEQGRNASSGRPVWLIDPLDGTNNFAHGFPHVGLSLALLVEGKVVVGVIHDPLRRETFTATVGGGATLDGRPIRVSGIEHLEGAFLATGFPYDRRTAHDNNVERLDHFLRRSQGVRRAGAATLDLAYVACGRLDGFWEIRLKPWDVAAGILLVREAGGKATDFEGSLNCLSGEFIVASNGRIHGEMLRVIKEGAAAPRPEPVEERVLRTVIHET